jgi:hypothetical protein
MRCASNDPQNVSELEIELAEGSLIAASVTQDASEYLVSDSHNVQTFDSAERHTAREQVRIDLKSLAGSQVNTRWRTRCYDNALTRLNENPRAKLQRLATVGDESGVWLAYSDCELWKLHERSISGSSPCADSGLDGSLECLHVR